jgi:alanyl-tRNA synthetase
VTRRLYYDDARRLEFSSTIVEVEPLGGDRFGVVLEETCFYPTSGGQLHDRGMLGDREVEDVLDEESRIVHVIRGGALRPGDAVQGQVDRERREHHRQQHSGQHVLSRLIENEYGWATLGSRLGESMNTLEIPAPVVDPARLEEIEDRTNRVLWEGRDVSVLYLEPEVAATAGLRAKTIREGLLRVIEVEGFDRCPCGGTHVDNTAEVGLVAITGTEKIRGGTRIQFLCGERAVRWRRERVAWLDRTARQLTTAHELVPSTVGRLQDETRERKKRMGDMASELVLSRARRWREQSEDFGELRAVLRVLDPDEALAATAAARAAVGERSDFAVLVIEDSGKRQVLTAADPASGLDAGAILRRAVARFGGRGGGRPEFARGGCSDVDSDELLGAFREELRSESER